MLAAVAPAAAQSDASESEVDASQVCSEHHKFGAQPVDVAKTPDGAIVLAQIVWNWHDSIGCYLTLDEAATAVLREALPPTSLPSGKTAASRLCSEHHEFGENPVDVAKAADGAAVLARLVWNWHDSIGCYLTLDAEALETLQVAHAAANAPEATPDPSAPHGEGEPITGGPTFIGVPAAEPSGKCAHMIVLGVYLWEQFCAWVGYRENNPEHNWPVFDQEAAELLARIWAEVEVEGKPASPPTSELVPARTLCALHDNTLTTACYLPALHHIRRFDPFLETLLHEAAHALVANHPTIVTCRSAIDYNACVHNDIYRCVASHLYTAYAGIPDAGVCGTTPDRPATPPRGDAWNSSQYEDGTYLAWVPVYLHTMDPPYEDVDAWLGAICRDEELDIFFWVESGHLAGQYRHNDRIPGVYHFIPGEWWDWDDQRQSSHREANSVHALWHESTNNKAAFLPDNNRVDFVNQAVKRENDWVLIWLQNFNEEPFGSFSFSTEGAYTHIRPVTEECGWIWS